MRVVLIRTKHHDTRCRMPKSSGFFFLSQVLLVIHSGNPPVAVLGYNMSDVAFDDLGGVRAGTDSSACRGLSGPF